MALVQCHVCVCTQAARNSRASSGARCGRKSSSARRANSPNFLRFLLDHGITTLDTANTYGAPYTTEEFLGKAVKEVGRDKFEIVTKCGIRRVSPLRPENRIRHYDYSETELRTVGGSFAAKARHRLRRCHPSAPAGLSDGP